MAEQKPEDKRPQPGPQASSTGPHMDPVSAGDRFPTGAGGHPIPDIGKHPQGGRHTGATDRAKEAPEDPGAGDTEQTRSERGKPRS
jgi:hypothetical protein